MTETRPAYHPEQSPIGYMPLPEVYAALDYVLAVARGGDAGPAQEAAARSMLLAWLTAGPLPDAAAMEDLKSTMRAQAHQLTAAFGATLAAFIESLDDHPCPLPGSPFGDYYADLVQLRTFKPTRHGQRRSR